MKSGTQLARSAAIGALPGLRAFTPAARHNLVGIRRARMRRLRSSLASSVLTILAVAELVGDQLPITPSRLDCARLALRVAAIWQGTSLGSMATAGVL